jgi:hypothetical protein
MTGGAEEHIFGYTGSNELARVERGVGKRESSALGSATLTPSHHNDSDRAAIATRPTERTEGRMITRS